MSAFKTQGDKMENRLTLENDLTLLHNPTEGQLLILALMSVSGTNLEKILENQKELEQQLGKGKAPYKVVGIFADTYDCRAIEIGTANNLPVRTIDIDKFYISRGWPDRKDPDLILRPEFDRKLVEATKDWGAKVAAYAGYMSVASPVLVDAYIGVNVHPGDLSVIDKRTGKKIYIGGGHIPSKKAIKAGETQLRATTHMIERDLDQGRIFMLSAPLDVPFPEGFDVNNDEALTILAKECQNTLKVMGDWEIFPRTLQYIAEGRYARDCSGNLWFKTLKELGALRGFLPLTCGVEWTDKTYTRYTSYKISSVME